LSRAIHGEAVWCRVLMSWLELYQQRWKLDQFVITDIRFHSDLYFFRAQGARILRVVAPQRVRVSPLTDIQKSHVSEIGLRDDDTFYDGWIDNDPEHAPTVEAQLRAFVPKEWQRG
jgi:hypothetical protein